MMVSHSFRVHTARAYSRWYTMGRGTHGGGGKKGRRTRVPRKRDAAVTTAIREGLLYLSFSRALYMRWQTAAEADNIFLARIPHSVSHTRVQLVAGGARTFESRGDGGGVWRVDRLLAPDSDESPPPPPSPQPPPGSSTVSRQICI
jgi:hypothetical protein